MSGVPETILFEAVTSPPPVLSARGMRWLCGLALLAAAIPAVLFTLLGAWPILGFMGGEVVLVLGLFAAHRRWRSRAVELVRLTDARLSVRLADGRGRQEAAELEPYWTRLDLHERDGATPVLTARARGRRVELGRFLAPEEKREFAAALDAALRAYRTPRFDNPQLRG